MNSAPHTPGYFGSFYQTGEWEHTLAFRVDNPAVDGGKRVVCGCCVGADQFAEARKTGGSFLCEECGDKLGRPDAHDVAIRKASEMTEGAIKGSATDGGAL